MFHGARYTWLDTIPCFMKGNTVEALHDPATKVCIIPECLLDTLVGNKPLTPIDKYFKSPSRLFFECRGDCKGCADHHRQNRGVLGFLHLRYPQF